jgi:hypothetical protein
MSKVTLDAQLRAKLGGGSGMIELYDENDRPFGYFVPAEDYQKLLCAAAEAACPYSADELRAMQQESGGRPLAEIWRSLGQA